MEKFLFSTFERQDIVTLRFSEHKQVKDFLIQMVIDSVGRWFSAYRIGNAVGI